MKLYVAEVRLCRKLNLPKRFKKDVYKLDKGELGLLGDNPISPVLLHLHESGTHLFSSRVPITRNTIDIITNNTSHFFVWDSEKWEEVNYVQAGDIADLIAAHRKKIIEEKFEQVGTFARSHKRLEIFGKAGDHIASYRITSEAFDCKEIEGFEIPEEEGNLIFPMSGFGQTGKVFKRR